MQTTICNSHIIEHIVRRVWLLRGSRIIGRRSPRRPLVYPSSLCSWCFPLFLVAAALFCRCCLWPSPDFSGRFLVLRLCAVGASLVAVLRSCGGCRVRFIHSIGSYSRCPVALLLASFCCSPCGLVSGPCLSFLLFSVLSSVRCTVHACVSESLATSRLLGTVRFAVLGGSALGFPALVCAQPFLLSEAVRRMATYLYL